MAQVGPTEKLMGIAVSPIFPLFVLKIEESSKVADPNIVRVEVHKEIYKYLTSTFGRDEIVFYLDP